MLYYPNTPIQVSEFKAFLYVTNSTSYWDEEIIQIKVIS